MTNLTGRTALVTGASRGIGRAIAQRLAADGALVAVHYGSNEIAAKETIAAIERAGGRLPCVPSSVCPAMWTRCSPASSRDCAVVRSTFS